MIRKYKDFLIVFSATVINLIILVIGDFRCPWKKVFNINCAGCGITRMFFSMFKLDFYQAFRFNPLMFSLLVVFFIYCIYVLMAKILKISYYKLNVNVLWILLVFIVVFTIVRNIPYFDFLKPTIV